VPTMTQVTTLSRITPEHSMWNALFSCYVFASRFLINLPTDEQEDMVRVFFQIELAHWYYIDFYCQEQHLPTYGLKEFTKVNILFNETKILKVLYNYILILPHHNNPPKSKVMFFE
jgi:hypothetical protein